MTQQIPATAVLGASKTGLTIGFTVYNTDRTVYAAFDSTNVNESPASSGTYHKAGTITVPDAGGYLVAGESGTDYAEETILPATVVTDIWSADERTLTSTAAQTAAAVEGSTLAIISSATYSATITGLTIAATWDTMYFTIDRSDQLTADDDVESRIQIKVTEGGDAGDGLQYLNGASTTASYGSLTVDQGAGTVDILIADDATVDLIAGSYVYDLKVIDDDGTSTILTSGTVTVADTPTRTIT
jgi:hypothetical protein